MPRKFLLCCLVVLLVFSLVSLSILVNLSSTSFASNMTENSGVRNGKENYQNNQMEPVADAVETKNTNKSMEPVVDHAETYQNKAISTETDDVGSYGDISISIVTPSIARECDYVHVLAASLLSSINPIYAGTVVKQWTLVNAEDQITPNSGLDSIQTTYSKLFDQDGWWKIHPAPDHGDLLSGDLKQLYEDSKERTYWRVKECYDYAACIRFSLEEVPDATHIIVIEDDALVSYGWVETVLEKIQNSEIVASSLFSVGTQSKATGTVAILYSAEFARNLAQYMMENCEDAPVDWLLNRFLAQKHKKMQVFQPNLVQHIGIKSSLAGKVQVLTSGTFGWGKP